VGFYEAISPYYDLIFPVEAGTVDFLARRVRSGCPSLDAACGTGGHAVALARRGHPVTGVDLDAAMIERARSKAPGLAVDFQAMDMARLAEGLPGGYGLVYCIGNSLVHLDSEELMAQALEGWCELLVPGGTAVVQIIHYDGILERGAVGLPTLRDEEHGLEFTRRYDYAPDRSSVDFHTVLTVRRPEGSGGKGQAHGDPGRAEPLRLEHSVALRILKRAALEALMRGAGFRDLEVFGGFDEGPLSPETLPLVLTARKPGGA